MDKIKLLFVCLGNICRSPAAEGVMKHLVDRQDLSDKFLIDSAGIGGWHAGELPDKRMRQAGINRGYNFNSYARQFIQADFQNFDYILIMDEENKKALYAKTSLEIERGKIKMLAQYCKKYVGVKHVPDPYYGTEKDFNYALDLIEDACNSFLNELIEKNNKLK